MQPVKPIKRSKELVPLSRDHHDGLLLCWKIRQGFKNGTGTERIVAYVIHFFEEHLVTHFAQEEQFVFDLLPDNDPMKIEALAQHDILKGLYSSIKSSIGDEEKLLGNFEQDLETHIRFEERELFPYIERKTDPAIFASAGKKIEEIHSQKSCTLWQDEFWTIK